MMCLHVLVRLKAELGWMLSWGQVQGWYAGHRCRVQVPVPDAQMEAHHLCDTSKVMRCIHFSCSLF